MSLENARCNLSFHNLEKIYNLSFVKYIIIFNVLILLCSLEFKIVLVFSNLLMDKIYSNRVKEG